MATNKIVKDGERQEIVLESMRLEDLRRLGKQVGVKNTHSYKKVDLIKAIANCQVEVKAEAEETEEVKMDLEGKKVYIETAPVGVLVAYKHKDGSIRSAKMVNRSVKNRKLKMETLSGKQFVISFDDVLWIKTGKKWPQKIYEQLKGNGRTNGHE